MKIKFLISSILLLIALIAMPVSGVMDFKFSFTGEGATISTYSYLKEPTLEYSGYTRGMKTGSMNYLENGTVSEFTEIYKYKYGNVTPKANSSLTHNMNIIFDGDKGISEFFGQGFFKNNRALSAWKKIRYETVRYPVRDPQGKLILSTRNASNISVDAQLAMDMQYGASYDLKYNATAYDAVIETRDQTRYTNVSKPVGIDWEHETLSRGDVLHVTNELSDFDLYFTLAGPGEWLPCCMSGTLPSVENEYSATVVLYPQKIMPNTQSCIDCRNKCLKNCTTIVGSKKANCSQTNSECAQQCNDTCAERCQEGACEGFECINTYEGASLGLISAEGQVLPKPAELWINAFMRQAERETNITFDSTSGRQIADHVFFILDVNNPGGQVLKDISINIKLNKDVMPVEKELKKYRVSYDPKEDTVLAVEKFDLLGGETKQIEIEAYSRMANPLEPGAYEIIAKGYRADGTTEVPWTNEKEFKEFGFKIIQSPQDLP